jgi:probable F420-dependent oxidoreductase
LRTPLRWLELAKDVEADGFDTLYVADHRGSTPAPFVALAAAATVTERLHLGTCVLNAGRWDPLLLASEPATLDVLSQGRCVLGIRAGHTPAEWSMAGLDIPQPASRVACLIEVVEAVRHLVAGDEVSVSGSGVELRDAFLANPRPVQPRIPLMVGGNGRRLLRFAATTADIVGVAGLGKTLADGHTHEADWRSATRGSTFESIHAAAGAAGRSQSIEVFVQHVEFADDAVPRAHETAGLIRGATASDILGTPFVWIGKPEVIVEQLEEFDRRWGVTRYVVREDAYRHAREIVRALSLRS